MDEIELAYRHLENALWELGTARFRMHEIDHPVVQQSFTYILESGLEPSIKDMMISLQDLKSGKSLR